MQNIFKTQAVVLRLAPYSESSRIVTWFTEEHGKIAGIIKGSQRRKSLFLGQYDLFYTCELLFYARALHGLHVIRECSPLKTRAVFRENWKAAACASYFTDLISKVCPFHAPQHGIFSLLDAALDCFAGPMPSELGLFWFEMKLLEALGIAPRLNECLNCRRALTSGEDEPLPAAHRLLFSCRRGGVLCKACAEGNPADAAVIAPDILSLLRFWQGSRNWRAAQSSRCSPVQVAEAERIIGQFMHYHLDVAGSARSLALDLMRTRLPACVTP